MSFRRHYSVRVENEDVHEQGTRFYTLFSKIPQTLQLLHESSLPASWPNTQPGSFSSRTDFLKTLGIKKPETDASKARKRGKVPPITVQPEDNKVDMVSVHDPHVHASSSQDRRAEEQNKTVMQEQEKTSDTAEPEVSPQDSPLDADLKSKETPNIAHATEDAATPKHVVDEAKANTRSGFASFFGWGSDDNGDDDDDDDDDLPSTKHGSYRKKA